jgi:hypothetical protein
MPPVPMAATRVACEPTGMYEAFDIRTGKRPRVTRSPLVSQRLAAVFMAGLLFFNYPLLAVFNAPAEVFGIPVLYAYLFAAWALLIGLLALVAERTR